MAIQLPGIFTGRTLHPHSEPSALPGISGIVDPVLPGRALDGIQPERLYRRGFRLFTNGIGLPFKLITEAKEEKEDTEEGEKVKGAGWKKAAPYLRGILLALPIVAILAALLSEADPIFSKWLGDLIELLRLEKLPEYILRLVLIGIWTFLLAGLMLYSLSKSREEKLVGLDQPWPPRFLGSTETTIIMGAVNLLFFSFVSIQFQVFLRGRKEYQPGWIYLFRIRPARIWRAAGSGFFHPLYHHGPEQHHDQKREKEPGLVFSSDWSDDRLYRSDPALISAAPGAYMNRLMDSPDCGPILTSV